MSLSLSAPQARSKSTWRVRVCGKFLNRDSAAKEELRGAPEARGPGVGSNVDRDGSRGDGRCNLGRYRDWVGSGGDGLGIGGITRRGGVGRRWRRRGAVVFRLFQQDVAAAIERSQNEAFQDIFHSFPLSINSFCLCKSIHFNTISGWTHSRPQPPGSDRLEPGLRCEFLSRGREVAPVATVLDPDQVGIRPG